MQTVQDVSLDGLKLHVWGEGRFVIYNERGESVNVNPWSEGVIVECGIHSPNPLYLDPHYNSISDDDCPITGGICYYDGRSSDIRYLAEEIAYLKREV